ncbi:p-loop containing nucleoside triphosphate hydrolase [Fusarium longipes]|uniref:p-loop containing nucleoside triphosphate hydrolase n=1 Tax=Fusarium longipes TaxID=694270 RepID=A0A395SZ76_9HYPO|nr:p-loop containing nucleoside triphosphate hydrolase [Fusarium longipes]
MSNERKLSNFEIFQQILKQQHVENVVQETSPHYIQHALPGELPPVQESRASFSTESDWVDGHIPTQALQPFLRQTFHWDQDQHREIELLEVPNDDWTIWTRHSESTIPKVWVRHQRVFDRSAIKVIDRLIVQAVDEVLRILFWDLDTTDAPWTELPDEFSDDDYPRRYGRRKPSRKLAIPHKSFKELFFRVLGIRKKKQSFLFPSCKETLKALTDFLNSIFPDAEKMQREAYANAKILYPYLWTLFPPGEIVYEKRSIRPFHDMYEQCFRVRTAEDFTSRYDGSNVFRLDLEEVIYVPSVTRKSGPGLVSTTRYIREYDGVKDIKIPEMGIIPFRVIPKEERDAIQTRLIGRSRRFLDLSSRPFSIWNYKGPLGLVRKITRCGTMEEIEFSQAERLWKKYTHQNVVIDLETSTNQFCERFSGRLYNFHDTNTEEEDDAPIVIPSIDNSEDPVYTEQSLLICRGYLPAYLLSSSDYAVGILLSGLSPPLWKPELQPGLTSVSLPSIGHWEALVREFFKEEKSLEVTLGRRETRGSGLALALQGPKTVVKMVADTIIEKLQRPMVAISSTDQDASLAEASKAATRWGGILFVEHRKLPTDYQSSGCMELANCCVFYPSVLLISCDNTSDLGEACEETIDGVISCNISSKDPVAELWKLCLTKKLPEFTKTMSDQRLNDICQLLAQLESREIRMEKILKTAQRLAVTQKVSMSLSSILFVIESSLTLEDLGEFRNKIKAAGLEQREN